MDTLWQDLRYGLRMLRTRPGFTLVAALTLALGIGANTAIFSVVNAVVLRPLPYPDPERLVMLWGTNARDGNQQQPASYAEFNDWKNQARSFSALAGASPAWTFTLTGGGEPEQIQGLYVSANLFPMLGVTPARGRAFLPEEDRTGGPPVVIVSQGLWQRRFGGDPNVIGKTLTLGGNSLTIVGIMPSGFQFLEPEAEVWVPLAQNQFANNARVVRLLSVIGRLKDDVKPEQASAELATIARQLETQYPNTNTGVGLRLVALHEQVTGKVRPALLLLFGAVGLVLLIACANVANLMLVRSAARRKEIAVRAALGAGRLRLIRQLLTESIALSVLGGAGGVLLAAWGVDLLLAMSPIQLPRYHKIGIDAAVLGFTLAATVVTGIVFGLAPAWQAAQLDLHAALKEGGRGAMADAGQRRLSNLLVIAETAMALVLLISAGLLLRSFVRLLEVDPGFATENVLTMQVGLPNATYSQPGQRIAFYQQLEERLKALPEVQAVGLVTRLPLLAALNNVTSFLTIEGRPVPAGQRPEIDFRRASTGYFQAMGIPLLSGRLVREEDVTKNTGAVLINEAMAKRFWPGEDPIGKRISTATGTGQNTRWQTIVGVVGNVRHLGLDIEPRPEIYYHTNTLPPFGPVLVIRTTSDPKNLIAAARTKVRELDRDLPISNINTMEQLVAQSVAQRRFGMLLLGIFAALALALAGIGIYGVMSYTVAERTPEIGIRMALGASRRDVLRMVIGQGMALSVAGIALGLAAAVALTRLMASWLFGVSATDPLTFATIALLLAAVALAACYLPARRATRVDPMVALRDE
jgi:putative ABC transport system permease protein